MFPMTNGMNEKGGITEVEFKWFFKNSIYLLFPDIADQPGKQVAVKRDSGLGRWGRCLILKAQFWGLYVYPRVPNATLVHQENDVSYGLFKQIVHENLNQIALAYFNASVMTKLGHLTFGLSVYGGICSQMGITCRNAVNEAFSMTKNREVWAMVGTVPFTKKCLKDTKA